MPKMHMSGSSVDIPPLTLRGEQLSVVRLREAKRSFVTRRAKLKGATLLPPAVAPAPDAGDLLLARIELLGHHTRIELCDGRRGHMFVGDDVILCYGHRYAPDQYHVAVPADLGRCAMVTSGGLAGQLLSRHGRVRKPTQVRPLGLLADAMGRPLNLRDFALPYFPAPLHPATPVFAVLGSSMNAGKTTCAAHLIRGLSRAGLRVAAAKVTGTGSGADVWHMLDAGANPVLDFSDAGVASTYRLDADALHRVFDVLLGCMARSRPQAVVLEVADGLLQDETAAIVASDWFREAVHGVVFAAGDALAAQAGVAILQQRGLPVMAVGGVLSMSPLAMVEAGHATGLPVLPMSQLEDPEMITPLLFARSETG